MRFLDALLQSRLVGTVLVVVLLGSVIGLAGKLWNGRSPNQGTFVEASIPAIVEADLESQVREHLESVRRACQPILDDRLATSIQRGRAYGELGKLYVAYLLPTQAIPCLANATRLDPADYRWPYLVAEMYKMQGDFVLASAAMTEALRRIPGDAGATAADQLAALCFLGEQAQRLNHPTEARRIFDDALRLNPQCVFALFHRAQLSSQQQNSQAAIKDFLLALRQTPNSPAVREALATEYRRMGDQQNVRKYALPAESNRKVDGVAYYDPLRASLDELNRSGSHANRLAVRFLQQGRVRAALAALNSGLKHNPESPGLRRNRALTFMKLEQYAKAQQDFQFCLKLKPDDIVVREQLILSLVATAATRQQGSERAQAWVAEDPRSATAQCALGQSLMARQDWKEALSALHAAKRLEPDDMTIRRLAMECRCALGEYKAARDELTALHDEYPQDGDITLSLVRALALCPDDTVRDAPRSLELIQHLLSAQQTAIRQETLACVLQELGRSDEALAAITAAIDACGQDGATAIRRRMDAAQAAISQGRKYRERWPLADPDQAKAIATDTMKTSL